MQQLRERAAGAADPSLKSTVYIAGTIAAYALGTSIIRAAE
jgi:hypothetical protein